MPLFFRRRKPSEESQKKLEYQLWRSKEVGADEILDVSGCELSEVPSGAFSICKVLQKKVLILHNNELKYLLPKGSDISALATLKVLDLHENQLTFLPDDIGNLRSLQILNVEKNRLKKVPESTGKLRLLQTLNLKGNCLDSLPSSLGSLSSLRSLDVSDNDIAELPRELGHIRTLESVSLDAASMSFPPAAVCSEGTKSIQQFLCSVLGTEYFPPSQYLLPVLETDCGSCSSDTTDGSEETWQNKFSDYEKRKEQKQAEKILFEQQLEQKQKEQQFLLLNNNHKEDMLCSVRQEQQRLAQGFLQQQFTQNAERLQLLETVRRAEDGLSGRITALLGNNTRQRKSSQFLMEMEEDRIRMEHLTAITQEEASSLRKRDVAVAMQTMLADSCSMILLQEANDGRRQSLMSETYRSMENLDRKFHQMFSLQTLDKNKAVAQILQEEQIQKTAFQALQVQKDAVHSNIRTQIKLIEEELTQLTKLEIKRHSLDAESLEEVLTSQRAALSELLQQLMKEREQRETELRQVLVEIELKSECNQQNYWMIQYQRLLDAKPLSLRMQEAGVEKELVHLLSRLSAQHFLPVLAHHRVTTATLSRMTEADLEQLGIAESGIQKALLDWSRQRHSPGTSKSVQDQEAEAPPPSAAGPAPSAPSPSPPGTPVTPSAPAPVDGPGSSECVVCMETTAGTVFLPCGHVCCCRLCSDALQNCPLCRAAIAQRIRLYQS
ncbi:E3 ubiquitin-protein ligase LRSAM1 isoform X2 [Cololabis saira]|uniref:E3 ubiquitin-protein ligase LRSAM1 isoform X2 n=1 Tax=Cololabis saira TaxID=129043 RepID=UPI002AD2BF10|nr:E3 ubiquitin-protein ligase LRSAM1 isoform X2 [Cololabis saira]